MSKHDAELRRLAAIMFTDIVGYTALMGRDDAAGRRVRERHEVVVRPLVARYHGQWVEERGDESLSIFPSALTCSENPFGTIIASAPPSKAVVTIFLSQGSTLTQIVRFIFLSRMSAIRDYSSISSAFSTLSPSCTMAEIALTIRVGSLC